MFISYMTPLSQNYSRNYWIHMGHIVIDSVTSVVIMCCFFHFTEMNQAFSLAARAVSLGNNRDIKKFYFSVPFMKCDVSASNAEYGILGMYTYVIKLLT